MNTRPWSCAIAGSLVVMGLLSVAPAFARQPDAWVTTKVKTSLILSPNVGGFPINVDTNDGRVTLSGKVSSKAEKAEAGRLAGAVGSVRDVRNLLQVVPESRRKAVKVADERVKDQVEALLKAEPRLADSHIGVKSVNQGVVLLDGKAATMSDHLLALELADRVDGVRRVASEIESPDVFGDREVWYDDGDQGNTNTAVGDAWITGKTKFHFMTDSDIPGGDINVDTNDGVVTLFGTVANAEVKAKAERVAAGVSGVKSVRNELIVVADSRKKQATFADDAIASSIERRLKDANLAGSDIKVEVKAGVARLTGSVKRPVDRYDAVVIARTTDGVAGVRDDMTLAAQE